MQPRQTAKDFAAAQGAFKFSDNTALTLDEGGYLRD
jgi:hypothetical protein